MDSELILSANTYRQGAISLNMAFSGIAQVNGMSPKIRISGGVYNVQDNDYLIVQLGPSDVNLPVGGTFVRGQFVTIINAAGGPPLRVLPSGGDTIDGNPGTYNLLNGETLTLVNRSAIWHIVSKKT